MSRIAILWILASLVLGACAPAQAPQTEPVAPAVVPRAEAEPSERLSPDQAPSLAPRMIVKRADLTVVVQDTLATLDAIREVVESMGGYVTDSNLYRVDGQMQARVTVRVPVDRLNDALRQIKDLAVRVDRENTSTEDVTEEYTDNASRLRNLEATEQELLALLREVRERPNATADEILAVHRRITEVRDEIERLKGRQQLLDHLVALATIAIEIIPDELTRPIVERAWRPHQTAREAFRALLTGLRWLADLAIWIVIFVLPILVLVALPFVALVLIIQRIRQAGRRPNP
ncbi:MAG: DUF4349 domain-containing protein [Anaerolineae bacterium]|nr:DUF4349 domain-containing protein [Anaerolineae bacterium]MDW8097909.1 DUF4349 domain-containing protein [Anaerolineae bacterium]